MKTRLCARIRRSSFRLLRRRRRRKERLIPIQHATFGPCTGSLISNYSSDIWHLFLSKVTERTKPDFIHSFIPSCMHAFIHSIVYSSIPSVIHRLSCFSPGEEDIFSLALWDCWGAPSVRSRSSSLPDASSLPRQSREGRQAHRIEMSHGNSAGEKGVKGEKYEGGVKETYDGKYRWSRERVWRKL